IVRGGRGPLHDHANIKQGGHVSLLDHAVILLTSCTEGGIYAPVGNSSSSKSRSARRKVRCRIKSRAVSSRIPNSGPSSAPDRGRKHQTRQDRCEDSGGKPE